MIQDNHNQMHSRSKKLPDTKKKICYPSQQLRSKQKHHKCTLQLLQTLKRSIDFFFITNHKTTTLPSLPHVPSLSSSPPPLPPSLEHYPISSFYSQIMKLSCPDLPHVSLSSSLSSHHQNTIHLFPMNHYISKS